MKKLLFVFAFTLAIVANAQTVLTKQQLSSVFPERTISRHPLIHSVMRTVQYVGHYHSRLTQEKIIKVFFIVKHYDTTGTYIPFVVDDLPITLTADTLHYIDPTIPTYPRVKPDSNGVYPSNSVREYDSYIIKFDSNQNIFETIYSQIDLQDANGSFNAYPAGQTIKID